MPDLLTSGLIATSMVCDSRAIESEAYSKKIKRNIIFYSFLHYLGVGVITSAVNEFFWPTWDLSFGVLVA